MTLDYFYGQSGELFSYFRIPKALFQDHRFRQLSTDARTLYGILLDRMSLSAKNGWLDEQGRVYIIYTVREVQESLCCAEHKAVKLFRELEQLDLIERKRRGLGRPSLIYVKDFSSGLPKAQVQNCPNSNSSAAESAILVQPKPQANKTDAAKLAGLDTLPVIVRQMSDDAAVILMVDSNLQREHILPSERAFAYKMKLEAIKNQGARSDLTSAQVGRKLEAADIVGQEAGDSRNQVRRFIRLTNLIRIAGAACDDQLFIRLDILEGLNQISNTLFWHQTTEEQYV